MIDFDVGDLLTVLMFLTVFAAILLGFPVMFTLAGVAIAFAALGSLLDVFAWPLLATMTTRVLYTVTNPTLLAVPLFIFMGLTFERSRIASDLLLTMGQLFGNIRGGLAISVVVVGGILAASTGIVGATVVTMGLISMPAMLRAGYDKGLAGGTICASGTLAQIIPPSTVLILLGMTLQNANTSANLRLGEFGAPIVTASDLFMGALIPGLLLVVLYIVFLLVKAYVSPASCPPLTMTVQERGELLKRVLTAMLPPLSLTVAVLGSILTGVATPTEAASIGALGALVLAILRRKLSVALIKDVSHETMNISIMIFGIMIGASIFTLVFRGLGGEDLVVELMSVMPGGLTAAILFVLAVVFFLGFFVDSFEIIFIVVPIFAPALFILGADPIWLGVALAVVLQTSYLTPPFGFAIFFLRGVTTAVPLEAIYRGVIPFLILQLAAVGLLWVFPHLAVWLPRYLS